MSTPFVHSTVLKDAEVMGMFSYPTVHAGSNCLISGDGFSEFWLLIS